MKRPLLFKFLAIGLLMLLLLIPIGMIGNSIDERRAYSEQVIRDIANSSSHSQTLVGPVLVVPYTKIERTWTVNEKSERVVEERTVSGKLQFLPDLFRVNGDITTELRKLGIYAARLYHADTRVDGHFMVPADYGIKNNFSDYTFLKPYVAVGISDIRGIKNSLKLQLNNQSYEFEPGSELKILGDGVHAAFPLDVLQVANEQSQKLGFTFNLLLDGTEQLHFSPIGKETHVELHSDWPHPRFIGNFLPVERSVAETGFTARWQTSYFSTNFSEYFYTCVRSNECDQYQQRQFGVSLIDPVNQYVKSDRAIKYALLFIALTFASFFLFEVLKRLQVHPVQYGLVGMALAFFYLLLLSLAEHIGFASAYALSSIACVMLIGFYVSHVLQSIWRGIGFTTGLSFLYALLYGLLSAEDYALLMGSLLLFVLLGVFMMLTRKVDWYSLGNGKADSIKE
ncbi:MULTISPECIES: cell envelope integrity protein CreD [Cellvibrio]|uniref:Inner membrane protein n=1 Tax=Cellvibrio fibrivorans TaxID=126350 RepID=A0ABU1V0K8_9GAMM|nr:cell envelope integrity protein CreD [Cellvibrio fibrivorans]MDR7090969.1 inner membrane protein [Cellvibrio fibrivorans]